MPDRVALVTGASRGIGRKLCIDLAEVGYDLVCVARSSAERHSKLPGTVDETAAEVRGRGRRALAVALDVRDEAGVGALAERVYAEWGRCDLLVNNAAVAPPRPALQDTTKRWRLAVDVNVNGPFYFIYYFAPRMAKQEGGHVVNVSSNVSQMPEFGRASYTTTKRALEGLTEVLACDLRDQVAVNCLRIDIPVWSEGFDATLPEGHGIRFEDPVVIGDAVLWLAKQPLSHTGRIHTVSGLREQGVIRPVTPMGG
jgi:citronellol/citronellal dehydrogenase